MRGVEQFLRERPPNLGKRSLVPPPRRFMFTHGAEITMVKIEQFAYLFLFLTPRLIVSICSRIWAIFIVWPSSFRVMTAHIGLPFSRTVVDLDL